jgi:SAM-dependent methyltransferase
MRPDDLEQLKDDLVNFRAGLEEPGVRQNLIERGLPRILATLEVIPDSFRDKDMLELGSSPYFLSLCLHRLCTGRLRHANYFGPGTEHGADRLVHQRTGEEIVFEYEAFNIETDAFPYADESFEVVLFSELIEHLGVNPVRALAEIHRVLRPGGIVVVTTPNAFSLERFATFLRGGSQMVDRYSPLFGYGARHNREYNPHELRELIEGTGFAVEEIVTRDLAPMSRGERLQRALWRCLLRLYSDMPRDEHIFLRARRGERFRWHFPPSLFDNIQFFTLVRHSWVEMGINHEVQTAAGWYPCERRAEGGGEMRWTHGVGQAFLKTPPSLSKLVAEVYVRDDGPARLYVRAHDRWLGKVNPNHVYVDTSTLLERGRWQRVELSLHPLPNPGDELEVMLCNEPIPHDPAEHERPAIDPPERERGIAVHRIWLE